MREEANNRDPVGRLPPAGAPSFPPNAASGHAAYNAMRVADVGRLPPAGAPGQPPAEPPPRRLRRLHRVWPDRDGNISYLLTLCVGGRRHVLNNEPTFERLVAFLLESPTRYHWFGRRFVVMPDHIHLIAHQGHDAIRLGQWIKALKTVAGGLKPREKCPGETPGLPDTAHVGRVPSRGVPGRSPGAIPREFTRMKRAWQWQDGYHDHKFRTPESEARKWEYVCLNPVRYGLVQRPEEWPFGGEIFYDEAGGPRLVHGTPPLLQTGMLIEEIDGGTMPREGTRPTI